MKDVIKPQAFGNSIQTSFSANSTTTPTQSTSTSNVLWGGAAAALLGATLAEWQRKRAEEEAARLAALRNSGGGGDEEGDSDAADKKRMKVLAKVNPAYARSLTQERNTRAAIAKVTAQELKGTNISVAQAQARQQAQWDANGQAIYAANQQFKETYGKEMDAATKEQAIKDATVNGVFNAGLYSVNLNTAQAKLEKAAEEQRRAEQAAMLEAQRQAAEEAAREKVLARGGGRPLAVPVRGSDSPEYEDCKPFDLACYARNVKTWLNNLGTESSQSQPTATPTSTPVLMTQTPTKTLHPDVATIIALQTANTPLPTRTPLPTPTFLPTLFDYGIETVGLDQQHKEIVFNAANLTGTKLSPYVSESRGIPNLAFRIAIGEVTIMIDKDAHIDDYGGLCLTTSNSPLSLIQQVIFKHPYLTTYDQKVDGQTVKVRAYVNTPQTIVCTKPPDEATLIHEFDHLLVNQQTMVQGTNFYDLTRSIPLGNGTLLDFQDGYWIRQGTGFQKGESSWAHRPYTEAEKVNGVGKIEHAADMFMNWVYDGTGNSNYGFTDDATGIARRQAMEEIIKSIFGQ